MVAFGKSKDSVDAFCARESINARTFRWWRWKLGVAGVAAPVVTTPAPKAIQVVEVGLAPLVSAVPPERARDIEVLLEGRGLIVRMGEGADAKYVVELVAELRARC